MKLNAQDGQKEIKKQEPTYPDKYSVSCERDSKDVPSYMRKKKNGQINSGELQSDLLLEIEQESRGVPGFLRRKADNPHYTILSSRNSNSYSENQGGYMPPQVFVGEDISQADAMQ